MANLNISKNVSAFPPMLQTTAYQRPASASDDALTDLGFTAYIEPHGADAWIRLDGGTPAANDGHQVAQNSLREVWHHNDLENMKITCTGQLSITLLTAGSS